MDHVTKETVNQPTKRPTNKVIAYTAGAVVAAWFKIGMITIWPSLDVTGLWEGMPILLGLGISYFVRDRRNV